MCLSKGAYIRSHLACSRPFASDSTIPRLFRGLYLRVFDRSGMLLSEPDVNAISILRQLFAFGKKLRIDCKQETTYEAVYEFAQVEASLPDPSLDWDQAVLDIPSDRLTFDDYRVCRDGAYQGPHCGPDKLRKLLRRVEETFDVIGATLGYFNPYGWRPKHGPGAVADLKGGSYKYNFPSWSDRLETIFPYADFAFANYSIWSDNAENEIGDSDITGSKLIAVPKTQKGPRLIAAEPVAHQWCQQALWDYFETRCSRSWIGNSVHFRDQRHNQEAARLASIHDDYWTVDLSSASDRVSLRLVERAFRSNYSLLSALHATRTRFLVQAIDKKTPSRLKLKKFSTMGSACTFPVESLIFLGCALASLAVAEDVTRINSKTLSRLSKRVLVFGDDIVVPSHAGELLEDLLTHLHFKVNQQKTFRTGKFRESCGLEAFDGVDVTPAYVLRIPEARRPESVVSAVESSNNFHRKGWWHAAAAIKKTVTVSKILTVSAGSGTFGWMSFCGGKENSRKRYSSTLHRDETLGICIRTKVKKVPATGGGPLLQYFTEAPPADVVWQSGAPGRPSLKLRLGWVATTDLQDCLPAGCGA